MSTSSSLPLPTEPNAQRKSTSSDNAAKSKATRPGKHVDVKWEVVTRVFGLLQAQIIAGRLQSENIPVRAWQESAGQAMGITVGLLGTSYVAVPEEFVEQALDILETETETETEEEEIWD